MAEPQLLPPRRGVKRPSSARVKLARDLIETVVIVALAFMLGSFAVRPFTVSGLSMQPALKNGEVTLVNQIGYDFGGQPQRGDVVALRPPSDPSLIYVKRVIGIPGDSLFITPDAIYLNGHKLNEPYVHLIDPSAAENQPLGQIKLGPGQYFVLGDNRQNSIDSRVFGYVPRQNIIGKVEFVYWPLTDVGGVSTYSSVFAGDGK